MTYISKIMNFSIWYVPIKYTFRYIYPEIVWESFDKYYSLDSKEWKLRYLLLFIILEALLGRWEKISHTIARHSAIIIGNELETGESIYDEIKNLYNLRSKIAHWEGIKEIRKAKRKIGWHAVKKLEQKVRKVMIYAIKYSKSEGEFNSKKLYQYLNTCWYTKKQ